MTPEPRNLNLELLIKLLKMTTSSHDGEALSAVRKANDQLTKVGGDWASLLRGKVTVMADPFMSLDQPPQRRPSAAQPPPARPSTPPPPRAPSPPPPSPSARFRANQYHGICHHCGTTVATLMGFATRNATGSGWNVSCQIDDSCIHDPSSRAKPAASAAPRPSPASRVQGAKVSYAKGPKSVKVKFGSKSLDDLDNLI